MEDNLHTNECEPQIIVDDLESMKQIIMSHEYLGSNEDQPTYDFAQGGEESFLVFDFGPYRADLKSLVHTAKKVRHFHKPYVHRRTGRPMASCEHADKQHYAKGKCRSCYQHELRRNNRVFKQKIEQLE